MKPIKFNGHNIVFAKNQPEYLPLPAYQDESGQIVTLWELSIKERIKILLTGKFWLLVLTFNQKLQPIKPTVEYPFEKALEDK